jgi:hypothetical protein
VSTIEKRIEALEAHQGGKDWTSCLVVVRPAENVDAKRLAEVAAFVAQHGREPDSVFVVRLVTPQHTKGDSNAA